MRNTSKAPSIGIKNKWPRTAQSLSYQSIAGGLASEMVGFLSSTESHESSPPFRLVIIGNHGGVVFECEVGEDCEVRNLGPTRKLPPSHFSATAFLTDCAFLTPTL